MRHLKNSTRCTISADAEKFGDRDAAFVRMPDFSGRRAFQQPCMPQSRLFATLDYESKPCHVKAMSRQKMRDWGAVEKPNKLRQKRECSKKQGLGTRSFSACLYLLFTAAGLFQHTHWHFMAKRRACGYNELDAN